MEFPKVVQDGVAVVGRDSLPSAAFKTLVDAIYASLLDPKTDASALLRTFHRLVSYHLSSAACRCSLIGRLIGRLDSHTGI